MFCMGAVAMSQQYISSKHGLNLHGQRGLTKQVLSNCSINCKTHASGLVLQRLLLYCAFLGVGRTLLTLMGDRCVVFWGW